MMFGLRDRDPKNNRIKHKRNNFRKGSRFDQLETRWKENKMQRGLK